MDKIRELLEKVNGTSTIDRLKSIIIEILEKPGIFIFGEFLLCPNIKLLQNESMSKRYYNTLELFTYGNYQRFMKLKDTIDFIELTPAMTKKLRFLTIIDLAGQSNSIPYAALLDTLNMTSVRKLEDLLIEAMFLRVIEGCMQQSNNVVCVSKTVARDVPEIVVQRLNEAQKRASDGKSNDPDELKKKKRRLEE